MITRIASWTQDDVTQRTLFQETFRRLRSRYPGADMAELVDATSNEIEERQRAILDRARALNKQALARYQQACYDAGYNAFLRGDAGQYAPGRNVYWFQGYEAAEADEAAQLEEEQWQDAKAVDEALGNEFYDRRL